jgi:rhodanese-related sulfurtransferase
MRLFGRHKTKLSVKFLELTGLYFIAGFLISLIIVAYLNSTIVLGNTSGNADTSKTDANDTTNTEPNASAGSGESTPTETTGTTAQGVKFIEVPSSAESFSFSFDDQFCTYIDNGKLYVVNSAKDELIQTIQEKSGISNAELMQNRNIIIYCTIDRSSKSLADILTLKTYNIENGSTVVQKSFDIPKGATVKNLEYSNVTSHVYLDIRSGSGVKESDTVYYLDIMKKLYKQSLGTGINQIALLNNSINFYYDANGKLYCDKKIVSAFNKKMVHVLGCDGEDNVYLQSLTDKKTIYILDKNNSIKSISLQDPEYSRIYSDKINLYAIYKDHIVNLSSDDRGNLSYDPLLHFIGMGGSNICFSDGKGTVIALPKTV